MYTIDTLIDAIADNAKSGQWLSSHFWVTHGGVNHFIGIKAFGKWVQRIEVCGLVDSVPEQKTLKALKAETAAAIKRMITHL